MKKLVVSLFLMLLLVMPVSSHAQASELSYVERQSMLQQIQELQAVLAQLLALYNQQFGSTGTDAHTHHFHESQYNLTFDYRAEDPLVAKVLKYTDDELEQMEEFGLDTREWTLGNGNQYAGIVSLGNEITADSLEGLVDIINLAAVFGNTDDEGVSVEYEDLGIRNGFEVHYIGQAEGSKKFGTYMAYKRFEYGGEEYVLVVRAIHGNYVPDDLLKGSIRNNYNDLYFKVPNNARTMLNTIIDTIDVDEGAVARRIENTTSLEEIVEQQYNSDNGLNDIAYTLIDRDDHIIGDDDALVTLITYTDLDCPFCKTFHETMTQVVDEYDDDEVAWVYRNFPLEQLHPNASYLAEAAECVAEQEGNDAYWEFVDLIFGEREVNELTDISNLTDWAEEVGADDRHFEDCLNDGDTEDLVQEDYIQAIEIGGLGTPHTVVVADGDSGELNGAQPYEVVKQTIDGLLQQLQ